MEEFELQWNQRIIDHIQRHGITPEEVEEVIYDGKPFFKRGSGSGKSKRYYVFGQTQSGRYLMVVLGRAGSTTFKVITARKMEDDEKRFYKKCFN